MITRRIDNNDENYSVWISDSDEDLNCIIFYYDHLPTQEELDQTYETYKQNQLIINESTLPQ